jgi:hypothetical protein
MDVLIDIINNDFQEILRSNKEPKEHIFLNENVLYWKKTNEAWSKSKINNPNPKYNFDSTTDLTKLVPLSDCKYVIKKILKKETLKKLYDLISNQKTIDYNVIQTALNKMYDYNLPSSIPNINNWKKYDNKNAINVMIIGAGPVGLFTALYLNQIYNKNIINYNHNNRTMLNQPVNILLIDNRIYKEGIKKPYSRVTKFVFDMLDIQPFIRQIFCWKINKDNNDEKNFDFINVLENLLYISAYHENIPMYFTKKLEDFNDVKKFVKRDNIHYVFDCTGGRFKTNIKHNMEWNKYTFKKGNQEIKFNNESKYFEFNEDNKLYTKTVLVLELLDKNMKQFLVGNLFGYVYNNEDEIMVNKYKNICLSTNDYIMLSKHFKDENLRQLFPDIIRGIKKPIKNVKAVKITSFNTVARHSPFAAAKITNKSTLIRLGDSLGGTEYGIIFGLRTSILFSKHICNLLSSVKYL